MQILTLNLDLGCGAGKKTCKISIFYHLAQSAERKFSSFFNPKNDAFSSGQDKSKIRTPKGFQEWTQK